MPKPHDIVKILQWWLSKRFGDGFEELGGSLDHGLQDDFTSCAFVTVNMMAHRVFNEPLWNSSRAAFERANWFVKVVDAHRDTVRDKIPSSVVKLMELLKEEARIQREAATTPFMGPKSMQYLMNSDQPAEAGLEMEQSNTIYSKPAGEAHTQRLSVQDLLNPVPPTPYIASLNSSSEIPFPCPPTSAAAFSPSPNLTSISDAALEKRDTSVEMVSDCETENGATSSASDFGTRMSIDDDSVTDVPAATSIPAPSLPKKVFPIFLNTPTLQQTGHKWTAGEEGSQSSVEGLSGDSKKPGGRGSSRKVPRLGPITSTNQTTGGPVGIGHSITASRNLN
jgi:hypothetical protein